MVPLLSSTRIISALLCAAVALALPHPSRAVTRLCPTVIIVSGEISPNLTDTEKRLVCGDPQVAAWREIPPPQAEFHLRNFLQERGYHRPLFKREGKILKVEIGERAQATRVELSPRESLEPLAVRLERKRDVTGRALTPTLLSRLEQWVILRLQAAGFPCPEVTTLADPDTGVIRLQIREGPRQRLYSIFGEGIPGLTPGVLRRYDAFELGDWLNADKLVVSANRAMLEHTVESLHHRISCGTDSAHVQEIAVVGPPRILSVGFGINTEGVLVVRGSWRNTRLGPKASSFDLSAFASAREQRIDVSLDWYHPPYPSRRFIRPDARLRHQNEVSFETLDARGSLSYGTSWDGQNWGWTGTLGPAFSAIRTYRGEGPPRSHFLTLDGQFQFRSHAYEFFALDPRAGFQGSLFTSFNSGTVFSSATAQRLLLRGIHLWNYRNYDPPLWIFGLRGEAGVTLGPERPGPGSLLPPNFLRFLGGSTNLRGYGRQELPLSGSGALTSLYLGAELRLSALLPRRLEPIVFFDVGALGFQPLRLDPPVFTSPGVGLRWFSPFGSLRTTIAHGFPADQGHWQFFLSYGEEF